MEQIFFRAVIALSAIGVLLGGPLYYFGAKGYDRAAAALDYEHSRLDSKEFQDCLAAAVRKDDADQLKYCYDFLGADAHSIQVHGQTMSNMTRQKNLAVGLAVVGPLLLFAAFYLLRWIVTGRLKDSVAKIN